MKYRLGRHRPRNVYVQHGDESSDNDVFVALFEDAELAKRTVQLLNMQEAMSTAFSKMPVGTIRPPLPRRKPAVGDRDHVGRVTVAVDPITHAEERADPARFPVDQPFTPNSACTCSHPYWMHEGNGACTSDSPDDTCVGFQRRCESKHERVQCLLLDGHQLRSSHEGRNVDGLKVTWR